MRKGHRSIQSPDLLCVNQGARVKRVAERSLSTSKNRPTLWPNCHKKLRPTRGGARCGAILAPGLGKARLGLHTARKRPRPDGRLLQRSIDQAIAIPASAMASKSSTINSMTSRTRIAPEMRGGVAGLECQPCNRRRPGGDNSVTEALPLAMASLTPSLAAVTPLSFLTRSFSSCQAANAAS